MYINMYQENNYEQTLFLLNSCLIVKTEQKHEAFCEYLFLEKKNGLCIPNNSSIH